MTMAMIASCAGFVLPSFKSAPQRAAVRMAECVDEFAISKEIKAVRIFDGDYVCAGPPERPPK